MVTQKNVRCVINRSVDSEFNCLSKRKYKVKNPLIESTKAGMPSGINEKRDISPPLFQ